MSPYLKENGKCAVYYSLLADERKMKSKFPNSYPVQDEMLQCNGKVYVYTKKQSRDGV